MGLTLWHRVEKQPIQKKRVQHTSERGREKEEETRMERERNHMAKRKYISHLAVEISNIKTINEFRFMARRRIK